VTDPRELCVTYLRQRVAAGEQVLFLERDRPAAQPPPARQAVGGSRNSVPEVGSPHDPGPRPRAPARKADWRRDAPPIPPPGIVISAPAEDLFTADPLRGATLEAISGLVRECRKCALCEGRRNAVPGEGPAEARLVVVGEGPGATEDETGRPFVGRAGELLSEILAAIDLPRDQVFICNIVKCRPPNNRRPQQDEIEACVPYLYAQLAQIKPAVIVAMGGTAAETLLDTKQSLASLRNRVHSFRGTPLIVTYHPAALLRNPHWKKPTWDDVRIARQLLDAHA
jgi:uracil-DNA glycosylase family 4